MGRQGPLAASPGPALREPLVAYGLHRPPSRERGHGAGADQFAVRDQAGNESVVVGREFLGEADAAGLHVGAACQDETHTFCASAVPGQLLVGDAFVGVLGPGGHRRHHHAIAQCDAVGE